MVIYRHRSSFKAKVCKGCLTKLFPAVFENPGEEYDEETEVTAPFSQPIDWQEDVSWQLDLAIILVPIYALNSVRRIRGTFCGSIVVVQCPKQCSTRAWLRY